MSVLLHKAGYRQLYCPLRVLEKIIMKFLKQMRNCKVRITRYSLHHFDFVLLWKGWMILILGMSSGYRDFCSLLLKYFSHIFNTLCTPKSHYIATAFTASPGDGWVSAGVHRCSAVLGSIERLQTAGSLRWGLPPYLALTSFNMVAKFLSASLCSALPQSASRMLHQKLLTGRLCHNSHSLAAHNVGWQPTNEPAICTED